MNTRAILPTALAVLCVLSIGVSATSLESAVATDPDDVIDLDWERLPVGEDTAIAVKAEMDGEAEAASLSAGDGQETLPQSRPGAGSRSAERAGAGTETAQSNALAAASVTAPDRFPWDLLWLLAGIGLLAVLGAVGYRYRDRFGTDADPADPVDASPAWPPGDGETEVDRAWAAMVERLDVERPRTLTPAELAAAAIEAGLDPGAVEGVTAAFEDVHYGGSAVTPTHLARARAGLLWLHVDAAGEPAVDAEGEAA